jgi:hypothetical protein
VLADRGFADQKLYALLQQVGFDYVIRFRQGLVFFGRLHTLVFNWEDA